MIKAWPFRLLILSIALFLLSGCATYLERSSFSQMDARIAPHKPLDWPCRDRDGDGKSDAQLQTYPATQSELGAIKDMFVQPSGMLLFLPLMVIDLPISLATDTLMYPFDKRSIKKYNACLDDIKKKHRKEAAKQPNDT